MVKRITMDDIAHELNISKSLVSLALSGKYGVSDETRSEIVMKALEKNPKNRFQSAREMADALMKAKDGKLDPASVALESSGPRPAVKPAQQSARMRELSPRGGPGSAHRPRSGPPHRARWRCG